MSKKLNRVACGASGFDARQVQSLENGDSGASLVKRALMVFEGTHQGMFGPVQLGPEFLQIMVERFNREYENPKNSNDYPPVVKDHSRNADDVLGRIVPPLILEDWENPRTGETVKAVFGDLRIDDADAQAKVLSGKYSHVSISFDDDRENMGEIFEVSFVAVEAARGSQVLQQGEKTMDLAQLQASLSKSQGEVTVLTSKLNSRNLVIKETCKSLSANLKTANEQSESLSTEIAKTVASLRQDAVKSQLKAYVKEGRLTKGEFDKIDFEGIAKADKASQTVVLAAYKTRPVSTDVTQHGTTDAKPISTEDTAKQLSTANMRELVKAQKEGRKPQLSGEAPQEDEQLNAETNVADEDKPGMTIEDIEDSLTKLEGLSEMQSKLNESIERMSETLSSLQGEDEAEEEAS